MPSFEELRRKLAHFYSARTVDTGLGAEIHTVTFQPLRKRANQDRLVMHQLNIHGQEWLLLAVCDGHGGATTAKYTASHLPSRILSALQHITDTHMEGRPDRESVLEKFDFISSELARCIKDFDRELGYVVQTVCPAPSQLSAKQARRIVWEYPDALQRAYAGTTLAAAVVNLHHRFMWTMNVGDSTLALSTVDDNGKRSAHELCVRHSPERDDTLKDHAGEAIIQHGRVLGSLAVTRAIGDFAFKLPVDYSYRLFRLLSAEFGTQTLRDSVLERIRSPPYITADPFVQFIDLEAFWEQQPVLMIFTDGVDKLLNRSRYYFNAWSKPRDIIEPARAVAVLLQDDVDKSVEELLGFSVDPRWSGDLHNRALDVLGNLVGGTDTRILQMVMDQDLLADRTAYPSLHIDDTSIVICSFADPPSPSQTS
ncbi:protein serine/threonine phosphatase 2C [Dichomitus squalens LYAD-421 SS1]|uniref:protein-serine/threonine phosphatase n=1 Tax=Dichomitus squalens TaxID=114155 RepID=A0A4Q9N126_9APHY|nr:protein serine/threonine phosphatase 2C [Dichomitus squalens LYAD-421 SS1]EJF64569.1 protein serine/threonine phosphatase 2C [Dichomitus squalens LYAD-421 SS1]TBU32601.1 protein serine/threonine phosphatase 2C [Dichomitus squalens]